MTIHFFTFSDAKGGSSRQRAFNVADKLRAKGFSVIVHKPSVLSMSRTRWPQKGILILQMIKAIFSVKKGDIIYLQRTVSNKYFFIMMVVYLFVFRRKMIFDFDDPVYIYNPFKTKTFARMADVVITCSHAQAKWARKYNKNIHIFHIVLDFPKYEKFTKDYSVDPSIPTIGWVGTAPEHINNLKILVPVFERLIREHNIAFKFVLIGALKDKKTYDLFQQIPNLDVEFIDELDWDDSKSVPHEIQKFDIGVLPHQSSGRWNKDKTSFKMLEYMSCKVSAIVSNFGEMPYVIQDGINGYLASTEDEWVEKLKNLLTDKELRVKLGTAGQIRVRENYSYNETIPRLISIINTM